MIDPNDLFSFYRREQDAKQREDRWQEPSILVAMLLVFLAGIILGWTGATW